MKAKTRWSRAEALPVAAEICLRLKPVTERLIVAGSLRRHRAEVGDVEILYVSRTEERAADLFTTHTFHLADEAIESMIAEGILEKRESVRGSTIWGERNKIARHRTGIPVDLFATTAEAWFNYLVCRTGPADSNVRIAAAAKARGFQWNPYGVGFLDLSNGRVIPMHSEEEVFRFVELRYLEPRHRR